VGQRRCTASNCQGLLPRLHPRQHQQHHLNVAKTKKAHVAKTQTLETSNSIAEALQYFATVFFALLMTTAAVLVLETIANSSNRLSQI